MRSCPPGASTELTRCPTASSPTRGATSVARWRQWAVSPGREPTTRALLPASRLRATGVIALGAPLADRDVMDRNDELLLRAALAAVAPGTELRDSLERILRGRTGALIVLGFDRVVDSICTGGFVLDM